MGETNSSLPTRYYKRSEINRLRSTCTFFYVSESKRILYAPSDLVNKVEMFRFGDSAEPNSRQISIADVGLDDLKLISFPDFEKKLAHLIKEDDSDFTGQKKN